MLQRSTMRRKNNREEHAEVPGAIHALGLGWWLQAKGGLFGGERQKLGYIASKSEPFPAYVYALSSQALCDREVYKTPAHDCGE